MYNLETLFRIIKIRKLESLSIFLALIATLIFDFSVSSSSISPFRYIYDVSFMLIVLVLIYVIILILYNQGLLYTKKFNIKFLSLYFLIIILLNINVIYSIIKLEILKIGFLHENILIQGFFSLFPLLNYLLVVLGDAILLYLLINREGNVNVYEIPTYALIVVALEVSLAIWCFHIGGINGIRCGLSLFHLSFCLLAILLYYNFNMRDINVSLNSSDILLVFLSIGTLAMVYVPFGIYHQFGDNAVIVSSLLSITNRKSLEPYYIVEDYYSPIGGFVSIVFSYIVGINNILLSSAIPFLIAHLMLPYIIYHFLKKYVTDDSSIAILGVIMTMLMDGLAVILLPSFKGNLTNNVINWLISPATKSLYFSSLAWMWLTPYKLFGMASAIAASNSIYEKNRLQIFFSGALVSLAFVNQRQPFTTFLLLIFLYGIRKINFKEITMIILTAITFQGPIFFTVFYKIMKELIEALFDANIITSKIFFSTLYYINSFYTNILLSKITIGLMCFISIIFTFYCNFKSDAYFVKFDRQKLFLKNIKIVVKTFKKKNEKYLDIKYCLFYGLVLIYFSFIVFYAFKYQSFYNLKTIEKVVIEPLIYIMLRYHILIICIICSFLFIKYSYRHLFMITILIVLIYLGKLIRLGLQTPIVFIILSMPLLRYLRNSNKKRHFMIIAIFIILGIFSSSLYSGIVKNQYSEPMYQDLPNILKLMIQYDDENVVYCNSTYKYYSRRLVHMANLQLTSDPASKLYIYDKRYTEKKVIEKILLTNEFKTLYDGTIFLLIERN